MDFAPFLPKLHSLNANSYPNLGKVEILAVFTLEKWKFSVRKSWKNGNY